MDRRRWDSRHGRGKSERGVRREQRLWKQVSVGEFCSDVKPWLQGILQPGRAVAGDAVNISAVVKKNLEHIRGSVPDPS